MKQRLRNTLVIVAMVILIPIATSTIQKHATNQLEVSSEETVTVSPVRFFLLRSTPLKTFSPDGYYVSDEFEIYGLVEEVALEKDDISEFTVYDEFGNKIASIDKEDVDEMLIGNKVKTQLVIRPNEP